MGKVEKIKNSEKTDKNSRISQFTDNLSSRIKEVFGKSPEIIKLFGRKWRLDKCENPDRVQEITINGENYLKISVKPGDKRERNRKALQRGTERAEIQQCEKLDYDKEYVQNLSFQIPKDFTLCPRRTVICQRKRSPELTSDDAPLLSLRIKKIDGEYYLVLTDGYREELVLRDEEGNILEKDKNGNKLTPYIPIKNISGKDVNLECKTKFSDDKGKSEVCVKMGENIVYKGPISIPHPTPTKKNKGEKTQAYFKFGLYRDCYKHTIRKIEKNKNLKSEEKKVQIEEIKQAQNVERKKDSYILLKDYKMEKS